MCVGGEDLGFDEEGYLYTCGESILGESLEGNEKCRRGFLICLNTLPTVKIFFKKKLIYKMA